MGSWFQKPKEYSQNLLVATLNYGGIIQGPFEFFSGDSKAQEQLSDIFHNLMPLYTNYIGSFSLTEKSNNDMDENKLMNKNDGKAKSTFKWEIGKIDQKVQKQRYTPVYNKLAGVQQNRLITQEQFVKKWEQEGKKWNKDQTFKESEMLVMKGFDLIAYHAILKFVYDKQISDNQSLEKQKIIQNLDSRKYINFMESYFSRDYLDQNKKIERIMYVLKKNFHQQLLDKEETMSGNKMIDVLFIQEPSEKLLQRIKNQTNNKGQPIFHVSGDKNSVVIIARKGQKRFNEFYDLKDREKQKIIDLNLENWPIFLKTKEQQDQEYKQKKQKAQKEKKQVENMTLKTENKKLDPQLFAIPETNILVCENFLFIGLHLSSKKDPNKMQSKVLKQQLKYLNRLQDDYDIIVAGDINSYLDNKGVQNYKVYPGDPRWITTNKKRTYMQAQYNKANQQVSECKDHIITNANMVKSGVITIEIEVATNKFLLPMSAHPFDHFMVVTLIKRRLANEMNNAQYNQGIKFRQGDKKQKKYYAPLRIVSS